MTSIVGPYAGVENDYRREQITKSFTSHTRGRRRAGRRAAKAAAQAPAIDWYGG